MRKYKQLLKNRLAQLQSACHGMEPAHRNSGADGLKAAEVRPPSWLHLPKIPFAGPCPRCVSQLLGIPEPHTGEKKFPLFATAFTLN